MDRAQLYKLFLDSLKQYLGVNLLYPRQPQRKQLCIPSSKYDNCEFEVVNSEILQYLNYFWMHFAILIIAFFTPLIKLIAGFYSLIIYLFPSFSETPANSLNGKQNLTIPYEYYVQNIQSVSPFDLVGIIQLYQNLSIDLIHGLTYLLKYWYLYLLGKDDEIPSTKYGG